MVKGSARAGDEVPEVHPSPAHGGGLHQALLAHGAAHGQGDDAHPLAQPLARGGQAGAHGGQHRRRVAPPVACAGQGLEGAVHPHRGQPPVLVAQHHRQHQRAARVGRQDGGGAPGAGGRGGPLVEQGERAQAGGDLGGRAAGEPGPPGQRRARDAGLAPDEGQRVQGPSPAGAPAVRGACGGRLLAIMLAHRVNSLSHETSLPRRAPPPPHQLPASHRWTARRQLSPPPPALRDPSGPARARPAPPCRPPSQRSYHERARPPPLEQPPLHLPRSRRGGGAGLHRLPARLPGRVPRPAGARSRGGARRALLALGRLRGGHAAPGTWWAPGCCGGWACSA